MTKNVNYLTTVQMKLIFIIFLVLHVVDSSELTIQDGIIVDGSPSTITLRWSPSINIDDDQNYYNLSVKEEGRLNYTSLFVRENVTHFSFKRPNECFRGEFLLVSKTDVRRAYVKPILPKKIIIDNFVIVYNWYDEITGEIAVDLKWSNYQLTKFMDDADVKQEAIVHVIECGDGINAVIPQMEFLSTTSGRIILPAEYAKALAGSVQTNPKCLLLITIVSPIRICDTPIPVQERTDQTSSAKNSVVVVVDCDATVNLPCYKIAPTAGPGVFVPSPKCDPKNITSKWLSETKLQIEWAFEKTPAHPIRRYSIRYGKNNQKLLTLTPMSQDPLMDILSSMDVELGRLKTNENETSIVIALENNSINSYKISICALFDGNSDSEISWNIVPTYNIERRKLIGS